MSESVSQPVPPPFAPFGTAASWLLRLVVVTALVGIGAGIGGGLIALALHGIQHLTFGYSEGTFIEGLLEAPPASRVWALGLAGIIGGVGWWALRLWGRRRPRNKVVSIDAAVAGARMPVLASLFNAALQVIIVGLGASIGREVAPREVGALWASWLSDRVGISAAERRILVACGAGAGLAAVYSVPLGGAVFVVEILLADISVRTVLPALAASSVATLVAGVVVPTNPLYLVAAFDLSPSVILWAVVAGPVIGVAAAGFMWLVKFAQKHAPKSWGLLIAMPVVFLAVGVVALWMPAILGNGRSLAQIAFSASMPVLFVLAMTLVKTLATAGTIGAGAAGGTLTPSLAIGAGTGMALGGLWNLMWPGAPVAAFALLGAAAFLSVSMKAPFTAVVLVMEFTHQGPQLLAPMLLCVAGAMATGHLFRQARMAGIPD